MDFSSSFNVLANFKFSTDVSNMFMLSSVKGSIVFNSFNFSLYKREYVSIALFICVVFCFSKFNAPYSSLSLSKFALFDNNFLFILICFISLVIFCSCNNISPQLILSEIICNCLVNNIIYKDKYVFYF